MKEVLLSGLLLLENNDGQECREHSKNYDPCQLPIEGTIHPELVVVLEDLSCFVCREKKKRVLCSCVICVNVFGTLHA